MDGTDQSLDSLSHYWGTYEIQRHLFLALLFLHAGLGKVRTVTLVVCRAPAPSAAVAVAILVLPLLLALLLLFILLLLLSLASLAHVPTITLVSIWARLAQFLLE